MEPSFESQERKDMDFLDVAGARKAHVLSPATGEGISRMSFFILAVWGSTKDSWAEAGGLIRIWCPAEAWHIVGLQYMLME